MTAHHERPVKRVNPSGKTVWVARYSTGRLTHAGYPERKSAGSYPLRGPCRNENPNADCCAQHAIDAAYGREAERPAYATTVGGYAERWFQVHPRSKRTDTNYRQRMRVVLPLQIHGRIFHRWPMEEVKRAQVKEITDILLVRQGRAHRGALGILRVLSAMWQDAIDDEACETNPFLRPRLRAADPRIRKAPQEIRVWSWEQMHGFARAAGEARTPLKVVALRGKGAGRGVSEFREGGPSPMDSWRPMYAEAMVRVLSDCGLRLGELLALERTDFHDGVLEVRRTAHNGQVQQGTKTDHGQRDAGRVVPVGQQLAAMLAALPVRFDTRLMFPTPRGCVWHESGFYERVWRPAYEPTGIDPRPHEFRHAWVSHLRAARIDPADLAEVAGHTMMTATKHYTHALNQSADAIRGIVG